MWTEWENEKTTRETGNSRHRRSHFEQGEKSVAESLKDSDDKLPLDGPACTSPVPELYPY